MWEESRFRWNHMRGIILTARDQYEWNENRFSRDNREKKPQEKGNKIKEQNSRIIKFTEIVWNLLVSFFSMSIFRVIVVIAERWVCANERIKQNNKINTNIVCTKRLVVIFGVYNVHSVRIYYYMFHLFGFVNLDQEIILPRHTLDLVKINVFCLHTFIYSVIVVSLSLYGCMLHFDLLRFFSLALALFCRCCCCCCLNYSLALLVPFFPSSAP